MELRLWRDGMMDTRSAFTANITPDQGCIRGRFSKKHGKTLLTERYYQAPLKISKTFHLDDTGQLYVYMMDSSPGLLDRDDYYVDMIQDESTEVYLTNQSYTKVHPTPIHGAKFTQTFKLQQEALLEYFPEPLIPYKNSRYFGKTVFHLAKKAVLLYADIVTPGRTFYDECFQYASLSSQTEIYRNDRLIGWDHFNLEPRIHRYDSMGAMEQYTHMGTFWIVAEDVDQQLLDAIRQQFTSYSNLLMGASFMSEQQGITVRMLGHQVWELEAAVNCIWSICRELLLGKKPHFMRK